LNRKLTKSFGSAKINVAVLDACDEGGFFDVVQKMQNFVEKIQNLASLLDGPSFRSQTASR
jgi:hypothetical protein